MTAADKPSEMSVDVAVGGVCTSQGPRGMFSKTRTRVVSAVLVASLLVAGVLFIGREHFDLMVYLSIECHLDAWFRIYC